MWTGGATPSVTLTDSIISQAAGGLAPSTDPADTLSGLFTNTNASPYDIGAIGSNFAENLFSTLNLTQFTAGDQVEISNGTSSFRLTLVTQGTVLGGVNGTVISGTQTGFAVNGLTGTITLLVAVASGITIAGTVIPTTITDKDTLVGTAGQILSSTATGIEWIDNQVGTVTGTGTTNTLPIWFNGASGTLGDSILDQELQLACLQYSFIYTGFWRFINSKFRNK